MPLAQTTFNPSGGIQTNVSGGAGGGGMDPNMLMLMQLAQRRAQQQAQAEKLQQKMLEEQLKQQKMATSAAAHQRPTLSPLELRNRAAAENNAAIEQARGAQAQARTLTERGPQRYIFGLGYSGGPDQMTADVSKMTGAQRQAYLPQSSGFSGPSLNEQDVQRQQMGIADMARMQMSGSGFTGRFGEPTAQGQQLAAMLAGLQGRR